MSSYFETELQNILQQIINEYDTGASANASSNASSNARTRNTTTRTLRQTPDYNQQILDMLKQIITYNRYMMLDHREAMNNTNNIVKNYGIMILQEGSILYHTSDEKKLSNIKNIV